METSRRRNTGPVWSNGSATAQARSTRARARILHRRHAHLHCLQCPFNDKANSSCRELLCGASARLLDVVCGRHRPAVAQHVGRAQAPPTNMRWRRSRRVRRLVVASHSARKSSNCRCIHPNWYMHVVWL